MDNIEHRDLWSRSFQRALAENSEYPCVSWANAVANEFVNGSRVMVAGDSQDRMLVWQAANSRGLSLYTSVGLDPWWSRLDTSASAMQKMSPRVRQHIMHADTVVLLIQGRANITKNRYAPPGASFSMDPAPVFSRELDTNITLGTTDRGVPLAQNVAPIRAVQGVCQLTISAPGTNDGFLLGAAPGDREAWTRAVRSFYT